MFILVKKVMKVYTIYEIPGVKIGCDADWPTRAHEQGVNPDDCIVLQQETDLIQVSIDEIWWQIDKDYPVDSRPYFEMVEMNRKRAPKGGKVSGPINGRKCAENGTGVCNFESRSKGGKSTGPKNVESGHLQSISSKAGKKMKGKIWINNGIKNKRVLPERLEEFKQQGWVKGRLKRK